VICNCHSHLARSEQLNAHMAFTTAHCASCRPLIRQAEAHHPAPTPPSHHLFPDAMQVLNRTHTRAPAPTCAAQRVTGRVVRVAAHSSSKQGELQQHVAAAAVAVSLLAAVPAAHAATELLQPDVVTAVGSGAAVAGLGALLVATDPQKRCVSCRGCGLWCVCEVACRSQLRAIAGVWQRLPLTSLPGA
jgi:hypothetical protein